MWAVVTMETLENTESDWLMRLLTIAGVVHFPSTAKCALSVADDVTSHWTGSQGSFNSLTATRQLLKENFADCHAVSFQCGLNVNSVYLSSMLPALRPPCYLWLQDDVGDVKSFSRHNLAILRLWI